MQSSHTNEEIVSTGLLRPVRILFFDHTAVLGGGEIALMCLIRHIDRARFTPILACASEGPLQQALQSEVETHTVPLPPGIVHAKKDGLGIGTLLRVREVWSAARYVFRLTRFISQQKIQIVHSNSLKADVFGAFAAMLARVPLVWHVRDRIESDYLPGKVVVVFRLLARIFPNFIIANSQATLDSLRLPAPVLEERACVVHDGLQVRERIATPGPCTSRQNIGIIGRIAEWKGQHIFLEAAAQIRQQFPDARFYIVGSALFGEVTYEERLRSLVQKFGLADVVVFTGFRSDVEAVIDELDIVVHASITGEPFGQVIIEGMAGSKPVIATNGGGVPEIVQHGKTGLLVPMNDAQSLADAVCKLLSNPETARQMGREGRNRVESHFNIELAARKIEAVYARLLTQRSRHESALEATHSAKTPGLIQEVIE